MNDLKTSITRPGWRRHAGQSEPLERGASLRGPAEQCPALRQPGSPRQGASRPPSAFTLIEIMVVMALLTIIVLGLMAMFNQTQRAFRLGMAQADVLESGRISTDMIARELREITPTYHSNTINFYVSLPSNFAPLQQSLPASSLTRTDLLENLFFVTRENQTWKGIGYIVRTNAAQGFDYQGGAERVGNMGQVGTLYRFETNMTAGQLKQFSDTGRWLGGPLFVAYRTPPATSRGGGVGAPNQASQWSRVLDGVVEFRVRTYDTNGVWLTNNFSGGSWHLNQLTANTGSRASLVTPSEPELCCFSNNIVPAYVELEIGILEPKVLEQYNSIPDIPGPNNPKDAFLRNHIGAVHVFRQRIAIRNVDPTAYR